MVKQNIILSLIQQLSVDLKQDSAIKYRYLQDAVLSLGKLITFEWRAYITPFAKDIDMNKLFLQDFSRILKVGVGDLPW